MCRSTSSMRPTFDRPEVYGGRDRLPRFPAALRVLRPSVAALNHALGFGADVIHANDWPTACCGLRAAQPVRPPCLHDPHLGYQGFRSPSLRDRHRPDFPGDASGATVINYMAAGIRSATVARCERYTGDQRRHSGTASTGCWDRAAYLHGSSRIAAVGRRCRPPAAFGGSAGGQARCKAALQGGGAGGQPAHPLAVAVSRLVYQKGLDVLAEALPGGRAAMQFAAGDRRRSSSSSTWRWHRQIGPRRGSIGCSRTWPGCYAVRISSMPSL